MLGFRKIVAAGNDFLVLSVDPALLSAEERRRLCDRHWSIGADGIVHLYPATEPYHFRMGYWNADGELGSFCGNGARVAIKLAQEVYQKTHFHFLAADGAHDGEVFAPDRIGVTLTIRRPPQIRPAGGLWVDSGSPHLLLPVEGDLWSLPLSEIAPALRLEPTFDPGGVNVNFYATLADGYALRTYERGVEAETLSCGTACVALAATLGQRSVKIHTKGGALLVYRLDEQTYQLQGPVVEVASGILYRF